MRRRFTRINDDRRAAGGCLASGTRTVRAGGRVRFDGWWYQHDKLKEYVGQRVWCSEVEDIWYSATLGIYNGLIKICTAQNEYKQDGKRKKF